MIVPHLFTLSIYKPVIAGRNYSIIRKKEINQ